MKNRLDRYPQVVNTQDLLKFFGIILVTMDHVSTFFYYIPIFNVLGNAAAPLFFFLAGSHIPKRIHWEYLWLGIIITLVTHHYHGYWFGNILISFFIIKLVIYKFPKLFTTFWGGLLGIIPIFFQPFNAYYFRNTFFEYGGFGLSYAFSAQVRRNKKFWGAVFCVVVLSAHYAWMHLIARSSYALPFDTKTLSFHLNTTLNYIEVGLFYLVYIGMALVFIFFKIREFPLPNLFKLPILVVSRYSFHLYAAQMLLFSFFGNK